YRRDLGRGAHRRGADQHARAGAVLVMPSWSSSGERTLPPPRGGNGNPIGTRPPARNARIPVPTGDSIIGAPGFEPDQRGALRSYLPCLLSLGAVGCSLMRSATSASSESNTSRVTLHTQRADRKEVRSTDRQERSNQLLISGGSS